MPMSRDEGSRIPTNGTGINGTAETRQGRLHQKATHSRKRKPGYSQGALGWGEKDRMGM